MTGGRVENRFREKKRTRRLRAGLDYALIKTFCVDDAAVGNGKHQRHSFPVDPADCRSCLREGVQSCGRGEAQDRAGATQARMRWHIFQRLGWNSEGAICLGSNWSSDRVRGWFASAA